MALAAALIPGFTYRITAGPLAGAQVTIVDNKAFPDKDENGDPHPEARKITVRLGNDEIFVIPRLIDATPIADPMWTRTHAVQANSPYEEVSTLAPVAAATVTATAEAPVVTPEMFRGRNGEYKPLTDPMDPRLDHLRPDTYKVTKYINRVMPNGMTDVTFLLQFASDLYREANQGYPQSFMLKGDTQGGKTFLIEALAVAWAKVLGYPKPMPIFTLSGSSGVTDFDLFGQSAPFVDPTTGREMIVWLPGTVDLAARVGGLLYLDEVNALGERVTSSLHPLVDHRHAFTNRNKPVPVPGDGFMPEVVVASRNLWTVGTYNEGYRGMSDMNEAFANRFRHIEWGYDEKVEKALVPSPTIHLLADALRTARSQNKLRTPVGTASLQRLHMDVTTFGVDMALAVFTAVFKPQEREVVRAIVEDRSINILMAEELKGA
jgi:MoxR-like ATPase